MKNLKYVMENFVDWIAVEGEDYTNVQEMYDEIVDQFKRYIGHAMTNVGGIYLNAKKHGDPIPAYQYVPRKRQQEALAFVLKSLNEFPSWAVNDKLLAVIGPQANYQVKLSQFLSEMLTRETICKLEVSEIGGSKEFTIDDYLGMIYDYMFTRKGGKLQLADMAYQHVFVDNLREFVKSDEFKSAGTRSLTESRHATTCSRHAYCAARSFNPGDPLYDIAMTPRVHLAHKRPVVLKYLRKVYNTAKARSGMGDERTREHYRLLILKLDYLFG